MPKHIKIYKHFHFKKKNCDGCMKPSHILWERRTPKTSKHYCEGCALERGMLQ